MVTWTEYRSWECRLYDVVVGWYGRRAEAFFCYRLYENQQCLYVGQTRKTVRDRMLQHIYNNALWVSHCRQYEIEHTDAKDALRLRVSMIRSPDGSNSTSSLNAAEIYYIHNDRPIYNTTLYTNDAPCPPVSFANPVKLVPFDKYSDSYFGSTIITWDRHSGVIPSIKDPYGLDVRSGIIKSKAEVDLPENERHLIPPGSRLFKCDVNGQTAQYGIYWKVVLQNGQETDFSLYQDTAVFESWRLYSRQNKKEGYPP